LHETLQHPVVETGNKSLSDRHLKTQSRRRSRRLDLSLNRLEEKLALTAPSLNSIYAGNFQPVARDLSLLNQPAIPVDSFLSVAQTSESACRFGAYHRRFARFCESTKPNDQQNPAHAGLVLDQSTGVDQVCLRW
jgi:hypothetical protein